RYAGTLLDRALRRSLELAPDATGAEHAASASAVAMAGDGRVTVSERLDAGLRARSRGREVDTLVCAVARESLRAHAVSASQTGFLAYLALGLLVRRDRPPEDAACHLAIHVLAGRKLVQETLFPGNPGRAAQLDRVVVG